MPAHVNPRPPSPQRPYHSPLRREQAAATRVRVLDAALSLFRERGYASTSVRAIADTAGVSVQTLYQSWGSKSAIVEGLILRVKEEIDLPSLFDEMSRGAHDPLELLRQSAHISRLYSEAGWDVLELVRQLGETQADIAAVWAEGEARRYRGQRDVVDWIAATGGLRSELARAAAADTLWTLSAHDLYRLLTCERGYTPAGYEEWLFETSARLLLASFVPGHTADDDGGRDGGK